MNALIEVLKVVMVYFILESIYGNGGTASGVPCDDSSGYGGC